jgi:hypothetical protein
LEQGSASMTRRRLLLCIGAVLCLSAGTLAALLASDVRGWQTAVRASNARAVGDPSSGVPSAPDQILPFHFARSLLGLDDDLALRRALVLVRRGYTGIPSYDQSTAGSQARAQAETALARVIQAGGGRRRAAAAANLLGALAFVDSLAGAGQATKPVERSIVEFQNAIRLDPRNGEAKANLELALGVVAPDSRFQGTRKAASGKRSGAASMSSPGRGY